MLESYALYCDKNKMSKTTATPQDDFVNQTQKNARRLSNAMPYVEVVMYTDPPYVANRKPIYSRTFVSASDEELLQRLIDAESRIAMLEGRERNKLRSKK